MKVGMKSVRNQHYDALSINGHAVIATEVFIKHEGVSPTGNPSPAWVTITGVNHHEDKEIIVDMASSCDEAFKMIKDKIKDGSLKIVEVLRYGKKELWYQPYTVNRGDITKILGEVKCEKN